MIVLNQSIQTLLSYVICFIINIKAEDFYKHIVDDVEKKYIKSIWYIKSRSQ